MARSIIGENRASEDEVIERNIAKIRKEVDYAVMAVGNRVHDAILTAMDNVVMPRVEMAVRSVTESSRRGPSCVVQNPDQRNFSGNTENTPPMTVSSRVDLYFDQGRHDETCKVENFAALRPKYDRRAHAHHS